MNTTLRVLMVVVAVGAIVIFATRRAPAQGKSEPAHQILQQKAKAAHEGDPQAIRAFTDEIFNQQATFANAAESLKERVSRCEQLVRLGAHEPIQEKHFEMVFNEQVRAFDAPSFWRTNQSQIRLLRGLTRQLIPGFVEPNAENTHRVSEAMGPAEAAYILMQLAANKLLNPEFQVEPEEWDRRAMARRRTGSTEQSGIITRASGGIESSGLQLSPTLSPSAALEVGLKSEHSEITAAAHRVLDELGFQR